MTCLSHDLATSAPQGIFLAGLNTKFRAFVGGFGSGKTFIGCVDLMLFAGQHPKQRQGYFAPTYRDIRDTFWPTIQEVGEMLGFRVVVRSGDKEVHLYRGRVWYGTIICRSMDDPGSIVGFKIARALVDEIDILPVAKATDAWRKIIARLRAEVPGVVNGVGVTTTPEGFKFVYQTFKKEPKQSYSMVQSSTYENSGNLPPDYIPSLMETYPQELVDAYLLGQFVNLVAGTVYRSYDRLANRSDEEIRPGEALHIGQDFNVDNMASVINVERPNGVNDGGDKAGWHVVGELAKLRDTPHLISVVKDRYAGHPVYIYPDASGSSRKTVKASESDLSLLRGAGFTVRAKSTNPPVKDRILALNAGYSKRRLWVNDSRAPTFADAQEQQVYDKNGEPDKTAGHDHHNDAEGYFAHWVMPIVKPRLEQTELRI